MVRFLFNHRLTYHGTKQFSWKYNTSKLMLFSQVLLLHVSMENVGKMCLSVFAH